MRPTPTVAAFGRVTSGGTSTRRSVATWTRQARRHPPRSSSVEKARVSSDEIGALPSSTFTLHLRHVPWPPQVESMAMPFQLAASNSITPGGTRTLRPAGSKHRSKRPRPSWTGSPASAAAAPARGVAGRVVEVASRLRQPEGSS